MDEVGAVGDEWDVRFVAYLNEVADITSLVYSGVLALPEVPRLMQSLRNPADVVKRAVDMSERATRLIDAGFATFHAQALVGLWGALESAVEDLAVSWVREHPGVLSDPALSKVKVPIALLDVDIEDRHLLVVREIQRVANSDLRLGIGQFESLLNIIGLSGPVPDNVRRELLFAQQARHLIAHRRGRVDARFLSACPFERLQVGDAIALDVARFGRIRVALIAYVALLADRVRVGSGEEAQDDPAYWERRLDSPMSEPVPRPSTEASPG